MKIVVTGAGGHVGNNLVRTLHREGADVRALDFRPIPDLPAGVEFVQGDVRDQDQLERCFRDVDRVFHLAALISIDGDQGGRVWDVNVGGARAAARAALRAGVGRFVHFSSAHAFDSHGSGVIDEDSARALGPAFTAYDRSKAAGEQAVREAIGEGLDGVIVHPTGVVGAQDHAPSRVGRVFLDAARGRLPVIVNGGFDWVRVMDVVAGALAAAERGRRGRNYILSGEHLDLQVLIERAALRAGAGRPLVSLPRSLVRPFALLPTLIGRLRGREALFTLESLDAMGCRARFSHGRAREELGYAPRAAPEAVEELVDWFVESGKLRARVARALAAWRTAFEQHLRTFPLAGEEVTRLLGPLLAEVVTADGRIDPAELSLLDALAPGVSATPGAGEPRLDALPVGVRESILLVALALAWVDEDHPAPERAAIERLRTRLGISPQRALELGDWARDYIVDQNLDAAYADGVMDAAERKRVEELAGRLDVSPLRLAGLDERARRRHALD